MERLNFNVNFYKMRSLFYKWVKTLNEKEITNFVRLYTVRCEIHTKSKLKESPFLLSSTDRGYGRLGAFRKYENVFFCDLDDFKIKDFSVDISEEQKRIICQYNFKFQRETYISDDIMILVKDDEDWKINYHLSVLSK